MGDDAMNEPEWIEAGDALGAAAAFVRKAKKERGTCDVSKTEVARKASRKRSAGPA